MFIKTLAREPSPLGVIARNMMPSIESVKLLCLQRNLGYATDQLRFLELRVVARTNGLLARHKFPYRVLSVVPVPQHHHIQMTWLDQHHSVQSELIDLYPPSKRKPADDQDRRTYHGASADDTDNEQSFNAEA